MPWSVGVDVLRITQCNDTYARVASERKDAKGMNVFAYGLPVIRPRGRRGWRLINPNSRLDTDRIRKNRIVGMRGPRRLFLLSLSVAEPYSVTRDRRARGEETSWRFQYLSQFSPLCLSPPLILT